MLELTDEQWFARLNRRRLDQKEHSKKLWAYYDNEQPLAFISKILEEQGDRFPPLRLNWSAVIADSVEERLDVLGFRFRGDDKYDEDLMNVWEANELDELSSEAHLASLVTGVSFLMVGLPTTEGGYPRVTVEYGDQVAVEVDPGTGDVVASVKVWASDTETKVEDRGVLWVREPDRGVRVLEFELGAQPGTQAAWKVTKRETQSDLRIPVVPMYNRSRRGRGHSELSNILPIVDAVNQTATNMLAALEHHALPRRWAVNVAENDFQDANGRPLPAWAIATGAVWAIPRADDDGTGTQPQPSVGQFTGAALDNFHNSVRLLALQASSLYGLPAGYFGYATENPASADAIRASEVRLIKRAERHQRSKGGTWERMSLIVLAMMGRDIDPTRHLETVWSNPATPTKTAQAQAAMELVNAGIIDREQAREDLGYSLAQREAIDSRATGLDVQSVITSLRQVGQTDPTGIQPPAPVPEAA